jgi:ribosomal-protein-alanine N-acetyltransferase
MAAGELAASSAASAGIRIRDMCEADVRSVARLERQAFTTPWTTETFHSLLEQEHVEMLVVEDEDEVVGYAVVWCVYEHGELANIAVDEAHRGLGLGSRLLDAVIERAGAKRVTRLYLEVRASNTRAATLYHRRGFEEIGRRSDYYDRPREDARVLLKRLP